MNPPAAASTPKTPAHATAWVLVCCAISLVLISLVYTQTIVFGSVSGQWMYEYFDRIRPYPFWVPVGVVILLGLMVGGGSRLIQRHEKMTLLACFALAVILQIVIQRAYPMSLSNIVQSDRANSFYSVAQHSTPLQVLSQYNNLASSFTEHARSNMPGKILVYQALLLVHTTPQRLAYLVIALTTLGALLLYLICKMLFHDQQAAFYALVLYVLLPCKLFFLPILNTLTPVFILFSFFLWLLYIEHKKAIFLVLLGISLYLLVLFEPSPLITGILFAGVLVHALGHKRLSPRDLWGIVLIPTLSFLLTFFLFWGVFSFNLLQALQYVLNDAVQFNQTVKREYWTWFFENPLEWLFGGGLPVILICIYLLVRLISQARSLGANISRWSMENLYQLSLWVTFGLLMLLGINRGETTRLWIYLNVFFQVPAALLLARLPRRNTLFLLVAGTLALQSIITLQHVAFVMPW